MSVLAPASDRSVAAALDVLRGRLQPLLQLPDVPAWEPGLRRPLMVSDLLRALAGGWQPNAPTRTDLWSVPNGHPEGAEPWHSQRAAADWLGVACVTPASDVGLGHGRAHAGAGPGLGDLAADAAGWAWQGRRSWGRRAPHWTETNTLRVCRGPHGPRGLLLATCIRRPAADSDCALRMGRCGVLAVVPFGLLDRGRAHALGLTALVGLWPAADVAAAPEPASSRSAGGPDGRRRL